jgi:CDGSH-type Zn-finger protein/uncharacterized Fe-S cluster protein YjdI
MSSDNTSENKPSDAAVEEVRGKNLLLRFEAKRCIHSRHCVLEASEVFLANVKGPWIHPDEMRADDLVAVAHNCPSGAITYERTDGGPQEAAPKVNVARIRENGPISLHADIDLEGRGPEGGVPFGLKMFRATLCRCGASKNKPFCDSSHHEINFTATGEPATQESKSLENRGGALKVTPYKDGPLGIAGNLEICSGTGRTVNRVSKTALCRCGHSANKPFCDGTHTKIGFKSE